MTGTVLIVNPNSNQAVTDGMDEALAALRVAGGPALVCHTLREGPFGIETEAHVAAVVTPLRDLVAARPDVDAFVIACFSDPGLAACREATRRPVLGIGECSVMAALVQGERFGTIQLGEGSIKRQARALRTMGVADRSVGSEPLHMSVAEAEEAAAYPRVAECGERLVRAGADVLILGCAGMARHKAPLARDLSVPVIDPTQAATAQALGLVLLAAEHGAVDAAA